MQTHDQKPVTTETLNEALKQFDQRLEKLECYRSNFSNKNIRSDTESKRLKTLNNLFNNH